MKGGEKDSKKIVVPVHCIRGEWTGYKIWLCVRTFAYPLPPSVK